jgi:hypothetical protein
LAKKLMSITARATKVQAHCRNASALGTGGILSTSFGSNSNATINAFTLENGKIGAAGTLTRAP